MPSVPGPIQQYWLIAKALGGPWFLGHLWFFFLLLSVPIRKKLFGRTPRHLLLTIGGHPYQFFVRDGADISVLYELFVEREYDISLIGEPKHIIDIGSHIGASALFFATKYTSARISAYEPDPDNFILLKKNTESLPHVECVQVAIAAHSGTMNFYKNNDSSIRSSLFDRGGGQARLQVRTLSLGDIVAGQEIDLIKFDVEGAELEVFADQSALSRTRALVGELHHKLINKTSKEFVSPFIGFRSTVRHAGGDHSILFLHRS